MTRLQLSWRMLWRDFRAGELRLIALAMVVAVASLSSVSFFSDRLGRALTREANQLLGGDLLLAADHPFDPAIRAEAQRHGLAVAQSTRFTSMVMAGEAVQLAGVKAVEPAYPLRGVLRTAPGLNQPDTVARGTPASGSAWLDERLSSALGVKVGDLVSLGNGRFTVAAVLTYESDRGASFFSLVPRILIAASDLPATGLIQTGSRIAYQLHFAGEAAQVDGFQRWLKPRLESGEKLEDISNARPEVRSALDRAERFLKLAALMAVVLAAVAVGLASRRYMERHLAGCAVMRCMGATQGQLNRLFLGEFVLFGLAAAGFGCVLGYLAQFAIERMLSGLLDGGLPSPGWLPVAHGYAVGLALLAGFVAPQVARLGTVPTLLVMRREWGQAARLTWLGYAAGVSALAGLMLWVADDLRLGAAVIGSFAGAVAIYGLAARVALAALSRFRATAGSGWRYGLASLCRRPGSTVVQAVALSIGLTAILLLTLAQGELLAAWRASTPPDAPNRFIVNIQPEQRDEMRALFAKNGLAEPDLLPMIRGRLVAVNGRKMSDSDHGDERARRLLEREFNLSYLEALPPGNRVVAGHWFAATSQPEFSVEQGLAQTLGLRLGDRLAFEIAGNRVEAPITSLRRLEWDSMRVNFFVIASPGVIDGFPTSYITAFHLPPRQAGFSNALVAAFPNLTVIDVAAVLKQFQEVMAKIAAAVRFVFVFAIVAGFLVLFAALESTHDERDYEMAIMRTLGARNRQLRRALAAEFIALGALSGVLAAAGAVAIAQLLAQQVFKFAYTPGLLMPAIGALAGVAAVSAAGLAGTLGLLRRPAMQSLRA